MDAGKIRRVFLFLLGLTYIGLGIFMFVKKVIPISPWGEILCLMFVLYGSWRTYRAISSAPEEPTESE
jgi:hypothetical protein